VLLGSLLLLPYTFVPQDWEACEGQLVPTRYSELFKLLGTQFVGDGNEEFALPDLSGLAPHKELAYAIAVEGTTP